ncbi:MAG: CDP-alcohol phosphatidyltransferase family protein, partial [Nevskia sp.]|nr:CDP-alcohol phosphatidyltransferase family protein [Nevskia sp.]
MTIPNQITILRLLLIPFFSYFVAQPGATSLWVAVGLFVFASATDWLDGYLARRLNQVT